jgi:hypothetical protein
MQVRMPVDFLRFEREAMRRKGGDLSLALGGGRERSVRNQISFPQPSEREEQIVEAHRYMESNEQMAKSW